LQGVNTRFPMDASPANFFVMRMGSQWSLSLRKLRRVVPGAQFSIPRSNSRMIADVYISSSIVHLPFRRGNDDPFPIAARPPVDGPFLPCVVGGAVDDDDAAGLAHDDGGARVVVVVVVVVVKDDVIDKDDDDVAAVDDDVRAPAAV